MSDTSGGLNEHGVGTLFSVGQCLGPLKTEQLLRRGIMKEIHCNHLCAMCVQAILVPLVQRNLFLYYFLVTF